MSFAMECNVMAMVNAFRFKVSLLPWNQLRFTFRSARGSVVDCDIDAELQYGRWFHVAATFSATSTQGLVVWLNGVKHDNLCIDKVTDSDCYLSQSSS